MAQIKISDRKIQMCKEMMLSDPMYKGKDFKNYSDVPNALIDSYLTKDRDEILIRHVMKECSGCAIEKIGGLIRRKEEKELRIID